MNVGHVILRNVKFTALMRGEKFHATIARRGAISFGLLYVPVELYPASKDCSLSLHLLDSRDFAPVRYQRINKSAGDEVDWPHIVKGYEYEKGKYVALSDADFKHANAKASETIDVAHFTDAAAIPAMCKSAEPPALKKSARTRHRA